MTFKVVRQYPIDSELGSLVSNMFLHNVAPEQYQNLRVDIQEQAEGYQVVAELPGVKKSDLKITVEKGVLTIQGKRSESVGETARVLYSEILTGPFKRTFVLPRDVDASKLEAELSAGLLTLTLPKAEKALPREISVK